MRVDPYTGSDVALREHWNMIAQHVGDISGALSTQIYRSREIYLFDKYLPLSQGRRLLKLDLWNEVNNTKILLWAAKEGYQVYGLDISNYLVEKTEEIFRQTHLAGTFICCDARKIEIESHFFDHVYTMGTIEHVPDYDKIVQEIYRVLKPGGRAIIGVPNKLDPFLRPLMVWLCTQLNLYPYAPEKSFTRKELRKLLIEHGFSILDEVSILFMPGWLRILDLIFYQRFKALTPLTYLPLRFLASLERTLSIFQKNGYLLATVVEKPK